MTEILKTKNEHNYDEFYIKTKEGTFVITFQPTLDLYWNYLPDKHNKELNHSFKITKENYFLYSLIEQLYKSIKNKTPYINLTINPTEEKYYAKIKTNNAKISVLFNHSYYR